MTTKQLAKVVAIQQRIIGNLWVVIEHAHHALDHGERVAAIRVDIEAADMLIGGAASTPE